MNSAQETTIVNNYVSLRDLSAYSGLSVRKLRKALKDSVHPLPHYRPGGGKVWVKLGEFEVWMSKFRQEGSDLESMISEIIREVK